MKSDKKYYSISEVSKMLNIKEHVIRHWDSIDPKTKKLRVENLSIRTKGGTRFFNKIHIKNISNLISILQDNGKRNYSLNLASKILTKNNARKSLKYNNIEDIKNANYIEYIKKLKKIKAVKNNLVMLIKDK
ncbi:MAG: hypothetical protein CMP16_03290 [Rickettsiales bacterium]|nr:hypothetical protein [Rickettsiales bacterium]|tara:strand:- start:66 stop:461 length:396 start_codon:yes stop_codon:yes gene_type:complete